MHPLAHPLAVPDGGKVLHIGLPKTGTTALQTALHQGRQVLVEQGVFNAAPGRHPYRAARFAAGNPLPFGAETVERDWRRVSRRFRESTARVTVLSSEAFAAASGERVRAIVEELGGEVHVVVTLRALAAQLRSRWQQSFVDDGRRTFDDWATALLDNEKRLHRIGPGAALDAWAPVVGEDRILFIVSDPHDRGALFRRFEALLGVTDGTLEAPQLDNAALPAAGSEFLRQLNLLETVRRDDPASARAEILREGIWHVQHLQGLVRDPVRVPRWAASRGNEIANGWIGRLQESSASVVGRPEDLLVDVDGLPEQLSTPEQIDVADAARFARELYDAAVRYYEKSALTAVGSAEDLPVRRLLAILRSRLVRRALRSRSPCRARLAR